MIKARGVLVFEERVSRVNGGGEEVREGEREEREKSGKGVNLE